VTLVCELVTDADGVVTETSPDAAALFAVADRWLVRKPLATFVAPRDRRRFRSFLLELSHGKSNGGPRRFAFESRDGSRFSAELTASHANGVVAWRVEAEARRKPPPPPLPREASERLFERLLTRLPQGVVVVDRDLRVLWVNPAARRLIGGEEYVRPGDPLPDPWPGLSLQELAASLFTRHPAAGKKLVETEGRTVCIEGLTAAHASTATLLLDDVTERERTRRSERRFVENAAHELRTPLAAIVSVIDVLESGAKDVPEMRDRFLSHIRAHSARLSRLATSLLVLARLQTGQEHARLELVPVQPLLNDVAAGLVPVEGVLVDVIAPQDLAALTDRDLLYQALENIASNATKHTRSGEIVFEARDLGRTTEIEVRDTGTGMEPEDVAHAFDRFSRGPSRDGFGLGLAIADEVITVLGGTIRLDSRPNVGTRVRVKLPGARLVG
jgi:signal transduction histidine kinase